MMRSTMDDEPLQTFDTSGNPTGLAPRSRVHREGLWHRAANVFVFRSDGRLIVQRRQSNKDVCAGAWDLSVAEHLKPGETYEEGARRGLREELGVTDVVVETLGGIWRAQLDMPQLGLRDYELQQCFRGVFDGELRPNVDEVSEASTFDLDDLGIAFSERPDEFTPWFRESALRLGLVRVQPETSVVSGR